MHSRITGLVAATFTPMNPDGSINTDPIPSVVDHLEKTGVSGIYVNGSTGEGPSLTIAERQTLAEAFVESARGRLTTMVQVGTNSTRESPTPPKSAPMPFPPRLPPTSSRLTLRHSSSVSPKLQAAPPTCPITTTTFRR